MPLYCVAICSFILLTQVQLFVLISCIEWIICVLIRKHTRTNALKVRLRIAVLLLPNAIFKCRQHSRGEGKVYTGICGEQVTKVMGKQEGEVEGEEKVYTGICGEPVTKVIGKQEGEQEW